MVSGVQEMIKINLILKDNNLKEVLKSRIKAFLNNNSQETIFVKENYIKDYTGSEILILFFEIENSIDIKRANEFKEYTNADCIVFLSKEESLVFETLRVNPLQFIRINNLDEDFENMSELLLEFIKNIDVSITLKSGTAMIRLNVKSIIFIESFGHYLIVHSTSGKYQIREKLSMMIEQINNPSFTRVHKSYIANINFVKKVALDKLILKDDIEIPIGRNFKEKFMQAYYKFVNK